MESESKFQSSYKKGGGRIRDVFDGGETLREREREREREGKEEKVGIFRSRFIFTCSNI